MPSRVSKEPQPDPEVAWPGEKWSHGKLTESYRVMVGLGGLGWVALFLSAVWGQLRLGLPWVSSRMGLPQCLDVGSLTPDSQNSLPTTRCELRKHLF